MRPLNSRGDIASLRRPAADDSSRCCKAQTQSLDPQSGFRCMIHLILRRSKTRKQTDKLFSGGIACTYRSSKGRQGALARSLRRQTSAAVGRLPPALRAFALCFYSRCSPCLIRSPWLISLAFAAAPTLKEGFWRQLEQRGARR